MRSIHFLLPAALAGCSLAATPGAIGKKSGSTPLPLDPAACFAEVTRVLADDDKGGRGLGTPGNLAAARSIAS